MDYGNSSDSLRESSYLRGPREVTIHDNDRPGSLINTPGHFEARKNCDDRLGACGRPVLLFQHRHRQMYVSDTQTLSTRLITDSWSITDSWFIIIDSWFFIDS